MKNLNILNSGNDVYLVIFSHSKTQHFVNGSKLGELGDLIKAQNKHGIEKICRYNQAKMKFEKVNKQLIQTIFGRDTHSIIELQNAKFIK